MKKPVTITLAEREFTINPLRLGTIREIDLARSSDLPADQRGREAFFFDLYVSVVSIAVREDNPDMTPEVILQMRTTLEELVTAYMAVLRLSGLVTENPPKGASESTGS